MARHEALDPYVRKVLIRVFIDDRRRGWWRRERPGDTPVEQPAVVAPTDDRLLLIGALASVAPRQRAVLVLRYWEDLSVEETAAALNCSPGTVKSQAARGLRTMRTLIAEQVKEPS